MKIIKILLLSSFICSFIQADNKNEVVSQIIENNQFNTDALNNAVILYQQGLLNPFQYTQKTMQGNQKTNNKTVIVNKQNKMITACTLRADNKNIVYEDKVFDFNEDNQIDNIMIPIFDYSGSSITVNNILIDNDQETWLKEPAESIKTIDNIIIFTSKDASKNLYNFKCNTNGETYSFDDLSTNSPWSNSNNYKNETTSFLLLENKNVRDSFNKFSYNINEYHQVLEDFVEKYINNKNPMNFIYQPVLTENVIPVNIFEYDSNSVYSDIDKVNNYFIENAIPLSQVNEEANNWAFFGNFNALHQNIINGLYSSGTINVSTDTEFKKFLYDFTNDSTVEDLYQKALYSNQNIYCDPNSGGCISDNLSFHSFIDGDNSVIPFCVAQNLDFQYKDCFLNHDGNIEKTLDNTNVDDYLVKPTCDIITKHEKIYKYQNNTNTGDNRTYYSDLFHERDSYFSIEKSSFPDTIEEQKIPIVLDSGYDLTENDFFKLLTQNNIDKIFSNKNNFNYNNGFQSCVIARTLNSSLSYLKIKQNSKYEDLLNSSGGVKQFIQNILAENSEDNKHILYHTLKNQLAKLSENINSYFEKENGKYYYARYNDYSLQLYKSLFDAIETIRSSNNGKYYYPLNNTEWDFAYNDAIWESLSILLLGFNPAEPYLNKTNEYYGSTGFQVQKKSLSKEETIDFTEKLLASNYIYEISKRQIEDTKQYEKLFKNMFTNSEIVENLYVKTNSYNQEDIYNAMNYLVENGVGNTIDGEKEKGLLYGENKNSQTFIDELFGIKKKILSNKNMNKETKDLYGDTKDLSETLLENNFKISSALSFANGKPIVRVSSTTFNGILNCTNYSPCPIDVNIIRDDGSYSVSVIAKTAFASYINQSLDENLYQDTSLNNIYMINSWVDNDQRVRPLIGNFYNTNTNEMERKFYVIYFKFNNNSESSIKINNQGYDITYITKTYGDRLNVSNENKIYRNFPTSNNAIVFKDRFDLDFKANTGSILSFKDDNGNKVLSQCSNLEEVLNDPNIVCANGFPNQNLQDIDNPHYVSNKNKLSFEISNELNNIFNNNNVPIFMMIKNVDNNKETQYFELQSSINADGNITLSKDYYKEILNILDFEDDNIGVTGSYKNASGSTLNDFESGNVNSYRELPIDIYVARKVAFNDYATNIGNEDNVNDTIKNPLSDKEHIKYPNALYWGRYLLNPQPIQVINDLSSTYWRDGATAGKKIKVYRNPYFETYFGSISEICTDEFTSANTYDYIVEYKADNFVCSNGGDLKEDNPLICQKRFTTNPSVYNVDTCELAYEPNTFIKLDDFELCPSREKTTKIIETVNGPVEIELEPYSFTSTFILDNQEGYCLLDKKNVNFYDCDKISDEDNQYISKEFINSIEDTDKNIFYNQYYIDNTFSGYNESIFENSDYKYSSVINTCFKLPEETDAMNMINDEVFRMNKVLANAFKNFSGNLRFQKLEIDYPKKTDLAEVFPDLANLNLAEEGCDNVDFPEIIGHICFTNMHSGHNYDISGSVIGSDFSKLNGGLYFLRKELAQLSQCTKTNKKENEDVFFTSGFDYKNSNFQSTYLYKKLNGVLFMNLTKDSLNNVDFENSDAKNWIIEKVSINKSLVDTESGVFNQNHSEDKIYTLHQHNAPVERTPGIITALYDTFVYQNLINKSYEDINPLDEDVLCQAKLVFKLSRSEMRDVINAWYRSDTNFDDSLINVHNQLLSNTETIIDNPLIVDLYQTNPSNGISIDKGQTNTIVNEVGNVVSVKSNQKFDKITGLLTDSDLNSFYLPAQFYGLQTFVKAPNYLQLDNYIYNNSKNILHKNTIKNNDNTFEGINEQNSGERNRFDFYSPAYSFNSLLFYSNERGILYPHYEYEDIKDLIDTNLLAISTYNVSGDDYCVKNVDGISTIPTSNDSKGFSLNNESIDSFEHFHSRYTLSENDLNKNNVYCPYSDDTIINGVLPNYGYYHSDEYKTLKNKAFVDYAFFKYVYNNKPSYKDILIKFYNNLQKVKNNNTTFSNMSLKDVYRYLFITNDISKDTDVYNYNLYEDSTSNTCEVFTMDYGSNKVVTADIINYNININDNNINGTSDTTQVFGFNFNHIENWDSAEGFANEAFNKLFMTGNQEHIFNQDFDTTITSSFTPQFVNTDIDNKVEFDTIFHNVGKKDKIYGICNQGYQENSASEKNCLVLPKTFIIRYFEHSIQESILD